MVVNNQYIESKRSLLLEHRCYCIGNGRFTVENRNDNRSLNRKIAGRKVNCIIFAWRQPGTHLFEMMGTHQFHLYLHVTLRRVHIVELFLTALAGIILIHGIHIFVMMIYDTNALHCQTQLIESGISIFIKRHRKIAFQRLDPEKNHETKIKIIAQATRLPINSGRIDDSSINLLAIMRICHDCLCRHSC